MQFQERLNNISALQLFQLIRYGVLFATGVLLVKSGVRTIEIGVYETFLFVAGSVSFFWVNGIIQTMLAEKSGGVTNKSNLYFNVFILMSLCSLLMAVLLLVWRGSLSDSLLKGTQFNYWWLVVVYVLCSGPSNLMEYVYLKEKQNTAIVLYGGTVFALQLLVVVVPPMLGFDISYSLKGLVVLSVVKLFWVVFELRRFTLFQVDWTYQREHIRLSVPLIGATLLSGSAQYIDGYIVTSRFSETDFAIFRYGARELPLALLLANAFSSAMVAEVGESSASLVAMKIKNKSKQLINWLFPLSIVLMMMSHELFPILFAPEFETAATIFNIYLLLVVSRLVFPQTLLIGLKRTEEIMKASIVELILNVSLSLILVNYLGLSGIAIATVVAYWFEKWMLGRVLIKKYSIRWFEYIPVKHWLIYSIIISTVFVILELAIY
ncbi:hypothetical protein EYV94_22530 [Puteibacter caeruleilacunae]|nr:hypothetical protein EYV94_22530 [Puteibacter caeruleilacunae]